MPFQVNPHVTRMNGYLPFNADSTRLYQEYATADSISLETRAIDYVRRAVELSDLRLLVLTGDAGHGKTHICAKLLEGIGYEPLEAQEALRAKCDGRQDVAELPGGRKLRIQKDLSDIPVGDASILMLGSLDSDDQLLVVCANEGRLREAVSTDPRLLPIQESLEATIRNGRLDLKPDILVLNLNFQSVAGDNPLSGELVRKWGTDLRRWKVCEKCDARPSCPIFENHRQLADGDRGLRRRAAIVELFRAAERIGAVITIRELLILTAYAMTGGLECTEVHRRSTRQNWQHEYLFTENLFGDRLNTTLRERARSFRQLRLLDPGAVALRDVDDFLMPDADDEVGRFIPAGAGDVDAAPTTRKQAKTVGERARHHMRFLRRRDFFSHFYGEASVTDRFGLRHANDFNDIVTGALSDDQFRAVRDKLVAGLEAVQGLRRTGRFIELVVVDPAFSGATGTSIISSRITTKRISIRSQTQRWQHLLGRTPDMSEAMDWNDRSISVDFDVDGDTHSVELDLLGFEYVMRAGEGLEARTFFGAETRRIGNSLAPLADTEEEQIQVLRDGRLERLDIDVGNVIRSVTD